MKYTCTLSHKFDNKIEISILRMYAPAVERFHDYSIRLVRLAVVEQSPHNAFASICGNLSKSE